MSQISRRARIRAGAVAVALAGATAALLPTGGAAASAPQSHRAAFRTSLDSTLQRLPDYFPGVVHWELSTSLAHYGTTDWDHNTIKLSIFTPLNLLYSVVAHEWSHEIQAYDYHRDFNRIVTSMNRHFGGPGPTGQRGVEYSADCMAILQGATWTHYTSCDNKKWRHEARRLLDGHELGRVRGHKRREATPAPNPAPTHKKKHAGSGSAPAAPAAPQPAPAPTAYSIPNPDGSSSSQTPPASQSPPSGQGTWWWWY